jgi:Domain of Unknown Function (DUF1080)
MKKTISTLVAAVSLAAVLGGCSSMPPIPGTPNSAWVPLVDGVKGLDNFNRVGDATWTATDGAIQATLNGKDPAYLVTKVPYKDFVLRAEVWVSDDANSGIFFRCQEPGKITDENCYEANLFDTRPDPSYGTGAIVKVAKLTAPMLKAGGKWNTYDITAKGTRLVLMLNGVQTVAIDDAKLASGPIALQWGRGTIKFRKVEIKPL